MKKSGGDGEMQDDMGGIVKRWLRDLIGQKKTMNLEYHS